MVRQKRLSGPVSGAPTFGFILSTAKQWDDVFIKLLQPEDLIPEVSAKGKFWFVTQQKQWIHLASLQWLYHLWVLCFSRIICWPYRLYGRLPVPHALEGLFLFWIPLACVSLKWGNPYCFAMWHLKLLLKLSLDAFYTIEPATCSTVLIIKACRPASCWGVLPGLAAQPTWPYTGPCFPALSHVGCSIPLFFKIYSS